MNAINTLFNKGGISPSGTYLKERKNSKCFVVHPLYIKFSKGFLNLFPQLSHKGRNSMVLTIAFPVIYLFFLREKKNPNQQSSLSSSATLLNDIFRPMHDFCRKSIPRFRSFALEVVKLLLCFPFIVMINNCFTLCRRYNGIFTLAVKNPSA